MQYPHFIAIDGSSFEEEAHPVAIAWSQADGQIKTTLIQPEDDWQDWDFSLGDLHGIDQDTLYQRGETCWSVIRELEHDLEQTRLISDDGERSALLLERLYDACDRDLSLEVDSFSAEFQLRPTGLEDIQQQLFSNQLPCEDRVRLMLTFWAQQQSA